jgi:small subunit ribosomal protein S6
MKDIGSKLENTKSKIINHIIWGKKKLAYPIKGNTYGNYIILHYEGGDIKKLQEFDSWLKLSGLTIRHMTVRLDTKPDVVESFEEEKVDNGSDQKSTNEPKKEENNDQDKKIVDKDKEVK